GNNFRHSKRQNSRLFLKKNNIFPITIKPSIKTELIRTALYLSSFIVCKKQAGNILFFSKFFPPLLPPLKSVP
ncbi:MAG: hypothetical protein LBT05_09010, partial [Planctomycetaceae bacterium]|nr:hypothetical protein [Planctomycetaceae bacterium]